MNLENLVMLVVSFSADGLSRLCAAAAGEILMTLNGWFQIFLFFGAVTALTKPLGSYMAKVFFPGTHVA